MSTYTYAIPDDDGKPADPHAGSPSLISALASEGDASAQVTLTDGVLHVVTSLTEPESDAAVAAWVYAGTALARCQEAKIAQIDARTEELLGEFTYLGNRYAMEGEQRIELLGTLAMANAALITSSPWTSITWPNREGSSITLATALEALAFTAASFTHASSVKQAGNTHKATVRALTTVADVELWSDPR